MLDDADLAVPEHWTAGVYASWLRVWYVPFELVLDFAVDYEPVDEGAPAHREVVARVRMPPGFGLEALQKISAILVEYEQAFGEIHRPGEGK